MKKTLDGVDKDLAQRIAGMLIECPELEISSAKRSFAEQVVLWLKWQAAVLRYGRSEAPKYAATAARPGTSKHERGLAVDVEAPVLFRSRRAELAKKFGLHTPVKGEPWHMEKDPKAGSCPKPIAPTATNPIQLPLEEDEEEMCTRTITWSDGTKTVGELDGAIKGFGSGTFHGSMFDIEASHKKSFKSMGALCANDPSDKSQGYTIYDQDGNPYDSRNIVRR